MHDKKSSTLFALTAAALALPMASEPVKADPPDQKFTLGFKQSNYKEAPIAASQLGLGSPERYTIDVSHLKFKAPISTDTELTTSVIRETMSGASPWYVAPGADGEPLQVMSGATISEERTELGVDFRSYHSNSEVTLSGGYSSENDYESVSFGFSGAWRLNQNLTTLSYGANTSFDYIDPSDAESFDRPEHESKKRAGAMLGITQVATKTTLLSATVGFSVLDGYLSDPYKRAFVVGNTVRDSRPGQQEQINLNLSLRQFFESPGGALHADYRYYTNNWEIDSHTLELSWYQNLGSDWQLIPTVRYYDQSAAVFYRPFYETTRTDGFYSSDYRLSDFSAVSGQLKLSKTFSAFRFDLAYETYEASGDHPGLLEYDFISLGLGYAFE